MPGNNSETYICCFQFSLTTVLTEKHGKVLNFFGPCGSHSEKYLFEVQKFMFSNKIRFIASFNVLDPSIKLQTGIY